MEKVFEFKELMDNTDLVKNINEVSKKIEDDKDLMKLLKEYNEYPREDLKKEIINNNLFQEYKDLEIDLNIFIMSINKKLKEISGKDKCFK